MLTELNDLGEHVRQNKKNFVPRFVTEGEIYKVICIKLKKQEIQSNDLYSFGEAKRSNAGYSYEGISVEDYSTDDQRPYKYYYLKGSTNGPNITLASLVTSPDRTIEKKIYGWLKKHKNDPKINLIKLCYEKYKGEIFKDVSAKYNDVKTSLKSSHQKGNVLLDFKIDEGGAFQYPLEISTFKNQLDSDLHSEFCSHSHGNSVCYLCGKEKEVCGNVLPALGLKFSTSDKPGFTPGLRQAQFWKSVPICMECAENVKFGYSYILNVLDFPKASRKISERNPDRDLGFRLMIIPSSINEEHLFKFLTAMEQLGDKGTEGFITSEDRLMGLYYNEKNIIMSDSFMFNFLFYKKEQQKFQIFRYLQEVLPSRLLIVEKLQQDIVRNQGIGNLWFLGESAMHSIFGNKFSGNFINGSFGDNKFFSTTNWFILILHRFYSLKVKGETFIDYRFFEIIDAVLGGQSSVNFDLVPDFMREIRKNLRKGYYELSLTIISSLVLLYILTELKIIGGEYKMDESIKEKKAFDMEAFFEKMNLSTDEERAAVAVGALVSKVLYVQRTEREVRKGSEPFWSKLNDLRIDHERLRVISTESIAKLREYQTSFPSIEESVCNYLARTDRSSALNREKTSYYFTVGLVLGDTLWPEREENEKNDIVGDVNE